MRVGLQDFVRDKGSAVFVSKKLRSLYAEQIGLGLVCEAEYRSQGMCARYGAAFVFLSMSREHVLVNLTYHPLDRSPKSSISRIKT